MPWKALVRQLFPQSKLSRGLSVTGTVSALPPRMQDLSGSEDPARASVRVLESAVALARAEARLAISEGRILASRAGVGLVLAWAAVSLIQVAIVMVSLSPALLELRPWPVVLLMVLPSVVLALVTSFAAIHKFRSLIPNTKKPSESSDALVSKEVRA